MEEVILEVVEKSSTTTFDMSVGNKIKGEGGNLNFLCGKCRNVLVEGIHSGQLKNIVLRCKCGDFNKVPDVSPNL